MAESKTQPTTVSVNDFLRSVDDNKRDDATVLISLMSRISHQPAVMWGPSIVGFGSQEYQYDSGRSGTMPILAFSPRKASLTIYFNEGFDHYFDTELMKLGTFTTSVACLYIKKLANIDLSTLEKMLQISYDQSVVLTPKPMSVDDYIDSIPRVARKQFDAIREVIKSELPKADEVLSYGIIGYKIDQKRARVFVSGYKGHVALYPVPKSDELRTELMPYIKGKGTLRFSLDEPLPVELIRRSIKDLAQS